MCQAPGKWTPQCLYLLHALCCPSPQTDPHEVAGQEPTAPRFSPRDKSIPFLDFPLFSPSRGTQDVLFVGEIPLVPNK